MIPTFACTYTRSLVLPDRARIVVREEAPLVAVCFSEEGELPAGVVLSGVRPAGQHDHDAKLVPWRPAELAGKDVHDLRRPQELVLQVDQVPGGAQRAQVRLDDPEVAVGRELVELLGDGAHDLQLHVAGAHHAGRRRSEALAGDRLPALRDVAADVGHRRPA
jgi:hypothetical protein